MKSLSEESRQNRLSSVTLPGSGGTTSFAYDPFGRRIYKSSSSSTSILAYDGDNLIEETNATGAVVARYSQGLNIDEPLAMLRSGTTSYYHADGLGSVTSLSSSAGALAQTYTYDSFGKQTASSGSLTNPFRYTGRESDSETSLYYYRARYYDQSVGRFLSEEPENRLTTFKSTSMAPSRIVNAYSYVYNNPINFLDSSGNVPQGSSGGGVGKEACTYYDDVAKQYGCKYHGGSGQRYCRHPGLNPCFTFRSEKVLNSIRQCLIEEDKKARQDPQNWPCGKPGCTKRSVIVGYHKKCFTMNGVSASCFPSWYPFDNDGE